MLAAALVFVVVVGHGRNMLRGGQGMVLAANPPAGGRSGKGCTNVLAVNFKPEATEDDGSCMYKLETSVPDPLDDGKYHFYEPELAGALKVKPSLMFKWKLSQLTREDAYEPMPQSGGLEVPLKEGKQGEPSDLWPNIINIPPAKVTSAIGMHMDGGRR